MSKLATVAASDVGLTILLLYVGYWLPLGFIQHVHLWFGVCYVVDKSSCTNMNILKGRKPFYFKSFSLVGGAACAAASLAAAALSAFASTLTATAVFLASHSDLSCFLIMSCFKCKSPVTVSQKFNA